ncbi:MAG TPA: efflux RND transporter permease subunit [Thermoanaerobaculia bacterium]|nr:efflux RND transporter permease subunit [Thermoanaerobaculia bacterium]
MRERWPWAAREPSEECRPSITGRAAGRAAEQRQVSTAAAVVAVAALGGMALARLPIVSHPLPERHRVLVTVLADLPRDALAAAVTRPLERGLLALPGAAAVASRTADGMVRLQLDTGWGADRDRLLAELDSRLAALDLDRGRLRVLRVEAGELNPQPLLEVAVLGGSAAARTAFAEEVLLPELARTAGLGRFETIGGQPLRATVRPWGAALAARGLTALDLVNRLEDLGRSLSAGRVRDGAAVRPLAVRELVTSLAGLRALAVPVGGGGATRLDELAAVDLAAESDGSWFRLDGRDGVLVRAFGARHGGVLAPAREARRRLASLLPRLPRGLRIAVVADRGIELQGALERLAIAAVAGWLLGGALLGFLLAPRALGAKVAPGAAGTKGAAGPSGAAAVSGRRGGRLVDLFGRLGVPATALVVAAATCVPPLACLAAAAVLGPAGLAADPVTIQLLALGGGLMAAQSLLAGWAVAGFRSGGGPAAVSGGTGGRKAWQAGTSTIAGTAAAVRQQAAAAAATGSSAVDERHSPEGSPGRSGPGRQTTRAAAGPGARTATVAWTLAAGWLVVAAALVCVKTCGGVLDAFCATPMTVLLAVLAASGVLCLTVLPIVAGRCRHTADTQDDGGKDELSAGAQKEAACSPAWSSAVLVAGTALAGLGLLGGGLLPRQLTPADPRVLSVDFHQPDDLSREAAERLGREIERAATALLGRALPAGALRRVTARTVGGADPLLAPEANSGVDGRLELGFADPAWSGAAGVVLARRLARDPGVAGVELRSTRGPGEGGNALSSAFGSRDGWLDLEVGGAVDGEAAARARLLVAGLAGRGWTVVPDPRRQRPGVAGLLAVSWDGDRLSRIGIRPSQLEPQLRAALGEVYAGRVEIAGVRPEVRLAPATVPRPELIPLRGAAELQGGRVVPLGALASVLRRQPAPALDRGQRQAVRRLRLLEIAGRRGGPLPPPLSGWGWGRGWPSSPPGGDGPVWPVGRAADLAQLGAQLRLAPSLWLALVFVALAAVSGSLRLAAVVPAAMAVALGGAVALLAAAGEELDLLSCLGCVPAMGLAAFTALAAMTAMAAKAPVPRRSPAAPPAAAASAPGPADGMSPRPEWCGAEGLDRRGRLALSGAGLVTVLPVLLASGAASVGLYRSPAIACLGGVLVCPFISELLVPALARLGGRPCPLGSSAPGAALGAGDGVKDAR